MAKSNRQSDDINQEHDELKLKYLDFVHVEVMQAMIYLASLYDFSKENFDPLKYSSHVMEGTIKSIISVVYSKLHDIPVSKFINHKVELPSSRPSYQVQN